ncbi:hypothetical protein GH714_011464 [Hevea brasiliensis]|uniref:GH10 domain-containing protein n=1 Tax=Hevea brasiliensis TaxID=3981 RepID=A0A6A6L2E9_HEVBR|nr:hypothetical protein GH714_011464 [Hevea brasiliensis]
MAWKVGLCMVKEQSEKEDKRMGTDTLLYVAEHNHLTLPRRRFNLRKEIAWVQINKGTESVAVVLRTAAGELIRAGKVTARDGFLSLLKERKRKVGFQVTYANRTAVEGAMVSIKQTQSIFPFGCAMNHYILESVDNQKSENVQGQENYTIAGAMVRFAKQNGISIRGHDIFWNDPYYQPYWIKNLSPDDLRQAAAKRINSAVSRYAGQLIAWDVMNENLHFSFYEDKPCKNASAQYFSKAHQPDPGTGLFMNEYNTIEYHGDEVANPDKYKNRLEGIL